MPEEDEDYGDELNSDQPGFNLGVSFVKSDKRPNEKIEAKKSKATHSVTMPKQ